MNGQINNLTPLHTTHTHTHPHPTDLQGQACRISIRITMQPPTRQSNTHTHTQSQTLRQPVVTSVRSLICEPMKCQTDSERKQKEKGASITRERENKSSSSRVGCPSSVSRRETAVAAIKVSQHICVCALFFYASLFFKASLPVMSRGGGGNDHRAPRSPNHPPPSTPVFAALVLIRLSHLCNVFL